jgi:hypothetical protein
MLLPYWCEWRSDRLAGSRRAKFRPALENLEDRMVPTLFGPPLSFPTGPGPDLVAVGDFNEDTHPDIAVVDSTNSTTPAVVRVLLNQSTGVGFSLSLAGTVGKEPGGLVTDHFTSSGHFDLAVTNKQDNTVSVLLGNGHDVFQPAPGGPFSSGGDSPTDLVVADFDGDRIPDLAVINAGSQNVAILRGNGDGSFKVDSIHSGMGVPHGLAVDDFNGDKRPDLAVAIPGLPGKVQLLLNEPDGFHLGASLPVGQVPYAVATADLNGDNVPDLVTANWISGDVSVLLGKGGGQFQAAVNFPIGLSPDKIVVADFNSDHHKDLVVSTAGGLAVEIGDGNGGFSAAAGSPFLSTLGIPPVAVGDFNNDTAPDLVSTDFNTQALVLLNQSFPSQPAPPSSSFRDLTPLMHLRASTLAGSPSAKHLRRRLTLQNTSGEVFTGTLWLVLDGLPRGVRVRRMAGRTTAEGTPGSPFVAVPLPGGALNPGQRLRLVLDFINPRGRKIRYTPLLLEGNGML